MDDLERSLLRRVWFPVARLEDLACGGVLAGNILGTPLVVYLANGVVTVADAACPHRGAALWMGELARDALACPYHGWRFAPGSGRCIEVPSGGNPPRVSLRTYPVRTAYGHVWSCLDEPYLPLPDLADWDLPGWQYGYGEPLDVSCGMRQLTENFRDMAHFAFVHRGTMGPNVRREVPDYRVASDGRQLHWQLTTDLGGTALGGNRALAARQTLDYRLVLPMFAYIHTRFDDGGRRLITQFVTPITADGERVRLFWVVGIDDNVIHGHGASLAEIWEYERQIFAEDVPIVENQYPAEAPLDVHGQAHTHADRFAIAYRRAYMGLLTEFAAAPNGGSLGRGPVRREDSAGNRSRDGDRSRDSPGVRR